jgi:hypothetical protein
VTLTMKNQHFVKIYILHSVKCIRARASITIYRLQACNLLLFYVVYVLNFSASGETIGSLAVFLYDKSKFSKWSIN